MSERRDPRTDVSSVTYNEDGSTTYMETYTTYPATKADKITTGVACALGVAVAFAPLTWQIFIEKRESWKQKREDKAKAEALQNEVK